MEQTVGEAAESPKPGDEKEVFVGAARNSWLGPGVACTVAVVECRDAVGRSAEMVVAALGLLVPNSWDTPVVDDQSLVLGWA